MPRKPYKFKPPAVILDGSSHLRFIDLPYFVSDIVGNNGWYMFSADGHLKTSKRDPGVVLERPILVGDVDRIAGVADVWHFEVGTWQWVKTPMSLLELLGQPTKPDFDPVGVAAAWRLKGADGGRVIGQAPAKYRGVRGPAARKAWLRDLYSYMASAVAASMHLANGRRGGGL
jgi:hypothetical protein